MPLNTTKDLTSKRKTSKMDGGTNMEKKQSTGKHKRKKKDQKGKIHDKYDELRKNVRRTNFVRRTTDSKASHLQSFASNLFSLNHSIKARLW